jgi:hypothetical protein
MKYRINVWLRIKRYSTMRCNPLINKQPVELLFIKSRTDIIPINHQILQIINLIYQL